ncbi:DNA polymerase delta subunit 4 isoform X1 [Heteronotia binoei]|uniref:DNA polymerase delta subunit 4 isoform X1 n=1 Tax=Heteronotia binoei TaxID=13085 RepID=UPI00292E8B1F|nr:DNA polymerase delta subunit 4 isoform X1 [Heteronotia binoei]
MDRKRLITDSFQVVKKKKRGSKEVKAQSPLCDAERVQTEALLQDAVQPDQVELLKQFDLSWEFGPCTGITRLQRWERAELLGLSPPTTVRELLLKYKGNPTVMHSLWQEYSL